jgi:hypothetical protein
MTGSAVRSCTGDTEDPMDLRLIRGGLDLTQFEHVDNNVESYVLLERELTAS